MAEATKMVELNISINLEGVKTSLVIDICPETFRLSPANGLIESSINNILPDLVVAEICPILMEVTPRLVEVNQLVSGNLLKACAESIKR